MISLRKNKIILIILLIGLIIYIGVSLVFFRRSHTYRSPEQTNNQDQSTIADDNNKANQSKDDDNNPDGIKISTINGYDNNVKNLSNEEKQIITTTIANAVAMNGISNKTISDATIRPNTLKQQLIDSEKSIVQTDFIVDIPSLQQSYKITDLYSPLARSYTNLYDYTTLAVCLDDVTQIIYPNFNCTDRLKQERGQ